MSEREFNVNDIKLLPSPWKSNRNSSVMWIDKGIISRMSNRQLLSTWTTLLHNRALWYPTPPLDIYNGSRFVSSLLITIARPLYGTPIPVPYCSRKSERGKRENKLFTAINRKDVTRKLHFKNVMFFFIKYFVFGSNSMIPLIWWIERFRIGING